MSIGVATQQMMVHCMAIAHDVAQGRASLVTRTARVANCSGGAERNAKSNDHAHLLLSLAYRPAWKKLERGAAALAMA
jgi:hypothetical protein